MPKQKSIKSKRNGDEQTIKITRIDFQCPISFELLGKDAVISPTGQSYNRNAITNWLAHNNTDPQFPRNALRLEDLRNNKWIVHIRENMNVDAEENDSFYIPVALLNDPRTAKPFQFPVVSERGNTVEAQPHLQGYQNDVYNHLRDLAIQQGVLDKKFAKPVEVPNGIILRSVGNAINHLRSVVGIPIQALIAFWALMISVVGIFFIWCYQLYKSVNAKKITRTHPFGPASFRLDIAANNTHYMSIFNNLNANINVTAIEFNLHASITEVKQIPSGIPLQVQRNQNSGSQRVHYSLRLNHHQAVKYIPIEIQYIVTPNPEYLAGRCVPRNVSFRLSNQTLIEAQPAGLSMSNAACQFS